MSLSTFLHTAMAIYAKLPAPLHARSYAPACCGSGATWPVMSTRQPKSRPRQHDMHGHVDCSSDKWSCTTITAILDLDPTVPC